MTGGHRERLDLGAYLLGGLEPAERAAFEDHLGGCPECRGELADLAGLPALLGTLSGDDVFTEVATAGWLDATGPDPAAGADGWGEVGAPALPGPPGRLRSAGSIPGPRSGRHSGARRRRGGLMSRPVNRILAAAAAVLLIFCGTIGIEFSLRSGGSSSAPVALATRTIALVAPAGAGGHASGTARLQPTKHGTDVSVQVDGIPPETRCAVILVLADGSREQVGVWAATYQGTGGMWADSPLSPAQVRGVEVRRMPDQATLLSGASA